MRLTGLLSILLFLAIVFFAAPAASHAQATNDPAVNADQSASVPAEAAKPDSVSPVEPRERPIVLVQPLVEHGGDLVLREDGNNFDNAGLCYSMRTYIMAREDKTSDVTHLVRKVRCTPARKFQFKSADQHIQPWSKTSH
jgi:hypothetical protein